METNNTNLLREEGELVYQRKMVDGNRGVSSRLVCNKMETNNMNLLHVEGGFVGDSSQLETADRNRGISFWLVCNKMEKTT